MAKKNEETAAANVDPITGLPVLETVETSESPASAETVPNPNTVEEAVEVLEILSADAVSKPEPNRRRGSSSKFPFDKLQVGQSIGVKGTKAEKLRPTVNNQNRKYRTDKLDSEGKPIYVMNEIKDAQGNVTGTVPSDKKEYVQTRKFEVYDVDSSKDPQGASARIFRVA